MIKAGFLGGTGSYQIQLFRSSFVVLLRMKINNTEISPADNILDLDLSEIAEKSVNALKIRVTDKETGNKWFGYLVLMTNGAGKPRVAAWFDSALTSSTGDCH